MEAMPRPRLSRRSIASNHPKVVERRPYSIPCLVVGTAWPSSAVTVHSLDHPRASAVTRSLCICADLGVVKVYSKFVVTYKNSNVRVRDEMA
jgi:hypothetical protein